MKLEKKSRLRRQHSVSIWLAALILSGAAFGLAGCGAGPDKHVSGPHALAKDTTELATLLLDKARVALVGGDAFGAPSYLRISYATSLDRIEEGLRRLDRFFSRAEAAA